ncbi:MAG: terpene cyclase/mutase family protein [Desulfarculaceae bacterium]
MDSELLSNLAGSIRRRAANNGGFAFRPGRASQPDATAWGVLALQAAGSDKPLLARARAYLESVQADDGSVPIHPDHPEACWPTPLAILAWQGDPGFKKPRTKAVDFLLASVGQHGPNDSESIFQHDNTIRGWPWISGTHSWVEPTAMAVIALRACGLGEHPRAREAVRMILNRQIASGGWNYGNTVVFGNQLHPMPAATGIALTCLIQAASLKQVKNSLDYLQSELSRSRTPQTVAWGVLALCAWGRKPASAQDWIEQTLDRQNVFGPYDTPSLALLLLALAAAAAPGSLAGLGIG